MKKKINPNQNFGDVKAQIEDIRDKTERKDRESNVIVYRLAEPSSDDHDETLQNDELNVTNLIKYVTDTKDNFVMS